MKNKQKKKKRIVDREFAAVVLAFVFLLTVMSRCIPAGTTRLNIGKSNIGEKAIALTFDDGPSDYTEQLLDGLNEYNVKVTFFVIGHKAAKNPEIVKRAYDEGHLIGNHTYNHPRLTLKSVDEAKTNIDKCSDIIKEITGTKPFFVRAPYGDVSAYQLKKLNCFFVGWSASTYDWNDATEDEIYNRLLRKAADGEIILMHDTKQATVNAVLRAIPELMEQGYEFVRVDDLLTRNGTKLAKGVVYRKCKDGRSPITF